MLVSCTIKLSNISSIKKYHWCLIMSIVSRIEKLTKKAQIRNLACLNNKGWDSNSKVKKYTISKD